MNKLKKIKMCLPLHVDMIVCLILNREINLLVGSRMHSYYIANPLYCNLEIVNRSMTNDRGCYLCFFSRTMKCICVETHIHFVLIGFGFKIENL